MGTCSSTQNGISNSDACFTCNTCNLVYKICSLVPRLPDLFNIAREKRGSLVKLIMCVTSGGTNFHIILWHNSKFTKIRARDTESSSSLISTLQLLAMNQQVKMLQPLHYESKSVICTITRSCPRPGGHDQLLLPCKSQFSTLSKGTEGPPLADS